MTIEGSSKVFEREGQEGRKVRFHFCPQCGTSLYWEADIRPGWRAISVGAFADPDFPPPSISIYEETKHAWLQLPEGIMHSPAGAAAVLQHS